MTTRTHGWNGGPGTLTVGSCPTCGKASYASRQDAKRAARGMYPSVPHRAVKCGQWWHIEAKRGESR